MSVKHRRWALGHEAGCQMRLPDICQWMPTVGSHIRTGIRFGKGTGIKPGATGNDLLMCLACPACHDAYDGRLKTNFERDFMDLAWHEGLCATLLLRKEEDQL